MLESLIDHNQHFRRFTRAGIPHVRSHIDALFGELELVQSESAQSSGVFSGERNELVDYFLSGGTFTPLTLNFDVPKDHFLEPSLSRLSVQALENYENVQSFCQQDWFALVDIDTSHLLSATQGYKDVAANLSQFKVWFELKSQEAPIITAKSSAEYSRLGDTLQHSTPYDMSKRYFSSFMKEAKRKLGPFDLIRTRNVELTLRESEGMLVVDADYLDRNGDMIIENRYVSDSALPRIVSPYADTDALTKLLQPYRSAVESEWWSIRDTLGPVAGAYVVANILKHGHKVVETRLGLLDNKKQALADEYAAKQSELDRCTVGELGSRLLLAKMRQQYASKE